MDSYRLKKVLPHSLLVVLTFLAFNSCKSRTRGLASRALEAQPADEDDTSGGPLQGASCATSDVSNSQPDLGNSCVNAHLQELESHTIIKEIEDAVPRSTGNGTQGNEQSSVASDQGTGGPEALQLSDQGGGNVSNAQRIRELKAKIAAKKMEILQKMAQHPNASFKSLACSREFEYVYDSGGYDGYIVGLTTNNEKMRVTVFFMSLGEESAKRVCGSALGVRDKSSDNSSGKSKDDPSINWLGEVAYEPTIEYRGLEPLRKLVNSLGEKPGQIIKHFRLDWYTCSKPHGKFNHTCAYDQAHAASFCQKYLGRLPTASELSAIDRELKGNLNVEKKEAPIFLWTSTPVRVDQDKIPVYSVYNYVPEGQSAQRYWRTENKAHVLCVRDFRDFVTFDYICEEHPTDKNRKVLTMRVFDKNGDLKRVKSGEGNSGGLSSQLSFDVENAETCEKTRIKLIQALPFIARDSANVTLGVCDSANGKVIMKRYLITEAGDFTRLPFDISRDSFEPENPSRCRSREGAQRN